jgi:hypothetical protein
MAAVTNYDDSQKQRKIEALEMNNIETKMDSNGDNDSMSSSSTLQRLQNDVGSIESENRTNFAEVNGFDYESKLDNHKEYKNHLDGSDTESESASEILDGERDPLLQPDKDTYMYHLDVKDLTSVPAYLHSESDDTDSYSTPTDSPAKKRLESLNLTPTSLNPLHAGMCFVVFQRGYRKVSGVKIKLFCPEAKNSSPLFKFIEL